MPRVPPALAYPSWGVLDSISCLSPWVAHPQPSRGNEGPMEGKEWTGSPQGSMPPVPPAPEKAHHYWKPREAEGVEVAMS